MMGAAPRTMMLAGFMSAMAVDALVSRPDKDQTGVGRRSQRACSPQ
jgi:hypothetical protein